MRAAIRRRLPGTLALIGALILNAPAPARGAGEDEPKKDGSAAPDADPEQAVDRSTWTDHDRRPIEAPPDWEAPYWGQLFHQGITAPLSHVFDVPDKLLWAARGLGADTELEAVNVNAFDECPSSSWFTNRNHFRPVPTAELRKGPPATIFEPKKPWTITKGKGSGWSLGFQIKDAAGEKWIVKVDPPGHPQLSSGADMVSRTLIHAAGYNVPNNQPVRFRRSDLEIDEDLVRGVEEKKFNEADLDSVLAHCAVFPDSSYSGLASLFLSDHVLGSPSMNRVRPGDTNDRYTHVNRRELRGLFVLFSWINNWDTKDHQFLDTFVELPDSTGYVEHYILDVGSSLGAAARSPKRPRSGFENIVDLRAIARQFITLGFYKEPWRRAKQETGIPSVGNIESEIYEPEDFRQLAPQPAFREMTDRDGYWGAKIVASFSDAQIAAAVDAGQYEDPRAREFLTKTLVVRRDKVARHWFGRVAPLDFFSVDGGTLRFHDLAVDLGLEEARDYRVKVRSPGADTQMLELKDTELSLASLGDGASLVSLEISIAGNGAKPTRVELKRNGSAWTLTGVKHG